MDVNVFTAVAECGCSYWRLMAPRIICLQQGSYSGYIPLVLILPGEYKESRRKTRGATALARARDKTVITGV